jgi:hypothetical protein
MEAARLARHGNETAAVRVAAAGHGAADCGRSSGDRRAISEDPPVRFLDALKVVARLTEQIRVRELAGTEPVASSLAGSKRCTTATSSSSR